MDRRRSWSAIVVSLLVAVGLLATPVAAANAAVGTCSVNFGAAASVTFVNNAPVPVDVVWVGYDCSETTYRTLAAGTSYSQATFTGHLWRMRSADGSVSTAAVPALPHSVITAVGNGICSTGSVSVPWSLTNTSGTALDVYWLDGQCNEVAGYGKIASGATRSLPSFVGHRWRLKLAGTQKVVGEATVLGAGAAVFSTPATAVLARSTSDRADDSAAAQIKVLYAVPSGGTDQRRDLSGRLALSVAAGNRWLSEQSGGRTLRMDTSAGALDITFVKLPKTAATYAAAGVNARDLIEADLKAKGFTRANKKYLAYYEGAGTACGTSYRPPNLPGTTSVVFLQTCPSEGPTGDASRFSFTEAAWVHEVFHGLGAAPDCAPHQVLNGHVSEDPADLMYAGSLPWRPALLDVGRDDYWTSISGACPGLVGSPFVV